MRVRIIKHQRGWPRLQLKEGIWYHTLRWRDLELWLPGWRGNKS